MRCRRLRAPIFEEKVVDYVLEFADVTDKTVSKEELLADTRRSSTITSTITTTTTTTITTHDHDHDHDTIADLSGGSGGRAAI